MDFYAWGVFIDILSTSHRVATLHDWPRNGWQTAVREIEEFIDWPRYWKERADALGADT